MSALPAPFADARSTTLTALVEVEDGDLVFVEAGAQAARALDVAQNRLPGRSAKALGFPSSARAQWVEALVMARRDGHVAQVALTYDTAREVRQLLVTATPADEAARRFACVIEDVTTPARAHEALENGRPALDALTALRGGGAFSYATDLRLIAHGGALPEGLVPAVDGIPTDLVGASLYDLLPKEGADALALALLDPADAPPRRAALPGDLQIEARAVRDPRGWPTAGLALVSVAKPEAAAAAPAARPDGTAALLGAGHERLRGELMHVLEHLEALDPSLPVSPHSVALRSQGRALLGTLETVTFARSALSQPPAPTPFRIDALLQGLRPTLEAMVEAKGLDLFLFVPDQQVWVMGHREHFGRAVLNAVQYAVSTTERGAIRLALREQADGVIAQVADTGGGMPRSVQDTVFGKATTSLDGIAPAVLDLYASRLLTEAMGGRVEVQSQPQRGTLLTFWLPAAPHETAAAETASLVLIEPDADARALLDLFLRDAWSVYPAISPDEALDLVNLHLDLPEVDAVLLDVGDDVGRTADRALRQLRAHPAFDAAFLVALVASSLPDEHDHYLRLGFDGVLAKPFSREALQNVLAPVLETGA